MIDGHEVEGAQFDKVRPHIGTITGRMMYLLNPRADDVSLEDIAHSLSRIVRWNGHIKDGDAGHTLTVAEHSLRVAARIAEAGCLPELELAALLHDAHEAYLGDIPTPAAYALGAQRVAAIKLGLDTAIHVYFGVRKFIPYTWQVLIKAADRAEGQRESDTRFVGRDYMCSREVQRAFVNKAHELLEECSAAKREELL